MKMRVFLPVVTWNFLKLFNFNFLLPFHSNSDVLEDQISFFSMFFFFTNKRLITSFSREWMKWNWDVCFWGIVWRKEEGRSNIEIPSKRLFLRYFPSHGLDWLIIKAWGSLFLYMCMYSIRISHHSMLSQGLPLTHEYE